MAVHGGKWRKKAEKVDKIDYRTFFSGPKFLSGKSCPFLLGHKKAASFDAALVISV